MFEMLNAIIIAIFALAAFGILKLFKHSPKAKGKIGEMYIHRILAQLPDDYKVFGDLMLKTIAVH